MGSQTRAEPSQWGPWARCTAEGSRSSLRVASRADRVVKKPFATVAFSSKHTEYRSWNAMLQLYKTLVRLHLEYCVQVWSHCYRQVCREE